MIDLMEGITILKELQNVSGQQRKNSYESGDEKIH